MSFAHPLALLLALLPLAWAAWEWRLSARRSALLLKAGVFLCVLLALSEPQLTVYQSKSRWFYWPTLRRLSRRRI